MLLDEVVEGFANKGHRFAAGEEARVAVDHAAAGGGVAARLLEAVESFFGRARGEDGRIRAAGELDASIGRGEVRIASQVVIGQDVMPERMGILRAEPVAPVVPVATELGRATLGFDFAGVGPEAEIATADGGFRLRPGGSSDGVGSVFAVVTAGGDIDPVVEAPAQAVGAELLIALAETGIEHFRFVRFAVAVVSSR